MKKKVISLMLAAMMVVPFSANAVLAEDSGEKTVVTFQTWNPGDTSATQEMIALFEEAHPDIEINFVSIPYVDHVEKLKVDLSAGEAADVYGIQTGAMYTEFRDFEDDLTPYMVETYGEDWVSDFNSYAMSLLQAADEEYYALPLGLSYAGYVWVNQTYLDKYEIATPQSYDDLKAASEILRENGEYPLAIGAKDDWINIDVWMNIAGDVNAEKLYSAIEGETPFTDEDLVESFRIWQNLFTEGIFQDGALGVNMYTDTTDLYEREGSVPMLVNGTWDLGTYVNVDEQMQVVFNSEDSNHEIVLIDWNNDGTPAHCQETVDVSLAINSMSPNKEAAWTFVDWMTHEGADFLCNQLSYLPARLSSELNVEGLSEDGQGCLEVAIENAGEGVFGEIFFAALQSAAFVESDKRKLIDIGLSYIPETSDTALAIKKTIECYDNNIPLLEARKIIHNLVPGTFGVQGYKLKEIPVEDNEGMEIGTSGYDAPENVAFTIAGWLYGENDFGESICMANSLGEDTDCTCATLGALMGIISGESGLPAKWKDPLNDKIATLCIDKTSRGIWVPDTSTELAERVMKNVPGFLGQELVDIFAPEGMTILCEEGDDLYCNSANDYLPRMNGSDKSEQLSVHDLCSLSPYIVRYSYPSFNILVDYEDSIFFNYGETRKIKVTVTNAKRMYEQQWACITLYTPDGVEMLSGNSVELPLNNLWGAKAEAEFEFSTDAYKGGKLEMIVDVSLNGRHSTGSVKVTLMRAK